ncbi:MAG: hypothetical protein AAGA50_05205 [Pseudomonadota bacterium]
MTFARNVFCATALAWLFVAVATVSSSAQSAHTYDLLVSDKKIGEIVLTTHPDSGGGYRIAQQLKIDTQGFWGRINVESLTEEFHATQGLLEKASSKTRESNKVYWSKVALSGSEYLAFHAQMKNEDEKEMDEVFALAKGVVSYLVPGAGDVMAIGSVILADDKNASRNDRFTKDSFDTSLMGLPLMWQRNDFRLPATLRVFDIQEMAVFGGRVSFKGVETVTLGSQKISAHRYSLEAEGGEPIDVWLRIVGSGLPHFVQLAGKESGTAFKIVLRP